MQYKTISTVVQLHVDQQAQNRTSFINKMLLTDNNNILKLWLPDQYKPSLTEHMTNLSTRFTDFKI